MACQYSEILGKVNEGLHSIRFLDIAIIDVILTFLLAYIISKYTGYKYYKTIILTFATGIIAHRFFCVRTTIDKLIFT
jgi:hypothetical protein